MYLSNGGSSRQLQGDTPSTVGDSKSSLLRPHTRGCNTGEEKFINYSNW